MLLEMELALCEWLIVFPRVSFVLGLAGVIIPDRDRKTTEKTPVITPAPCRQSGRW